MEIPGVMSCHFPFGDLRRDRFVLICEGEGDGILGFGDQDLLLVIGRSILRVLTVPGLLKICFGLACFLIGLIASDEGERGQNEQRDGEKTFHKREELEGVTLGHPSLFKLECFDPGRHPISGLGP